MKHIVVTNGKWLHNVYTVEKAKEWIRSHKKNNVYIKENHQWLYRTDTTSSCILEYDIPNLVGAIKANLSSILKQAGFQGNFQIAAMQLSPGKRQLTMYQAVLKITVCPIMPRIIRIGNKTIVQNLVMAQQKETRTIVFSNVQSNEYDKKPVHIRGNLYDYKQCCSASKM